MPRQCQGKIKSGYNTPNNQKHSPLELKNLTGAFIVLLIGDYHRLLFGIPRRKNH
jgi:hypothetical protein